MTVKQIACLVKYRARRLDAASERFWARVDIRAEDECWEWMGSRSANRYGQVCIGGDSQSTHRMAWMLQNGPIREKLCICHRCDNPPCCNPAHLFLGTYRENMLDCKAKGRNARGERQWRAKLTADDVRAIRIACADGARQVDVARSFGVSKASVQSAVARTTWKHIA